MTLTQLHYEEFTDRLDSIRDILRWTVTQFETCELFYGHGTDNSWDEALVLLQFYLKFPINQINFLLDSKLTDTEKDEIYQLLEKRINDRLPLPYITNEAWFMDMDFYVDNRVLIPRSPIAELIKQNFEPWLEFDDQNELKILEIGTGSGCISCALAHHYLEQGIDIKIDATDISQEALEVAKINVSDYGYSEVINLIQSDLFESIPKGTKYQLILSNPPYVDAKAMQLLPQEYTHEPKGALASGHDGLDCVREILKQAADFLTDNGCIIIEVGASQQNLEAAFPMVPFMWTELTNGGSGIFVLTKEQLLQFQNK